MEVSPNNPERNRLAEGVTETDVANAVAASGYPLQSVLAEYLRKSYRVQQEWSFIDSETKELRALDIFAVKEFWDWKGGEKQPRVRPSLDMLIECKQSSLPYVFFNSAGNRMAEFPLIAGLAKDEITITTDDDPSSWSLPTSLALGINTHDFVFKAPASASIFSRCARKGSVLELSGTEAFHSLMLPLIKAAQHHVKASSPPKTAWYFDYRMTVAIGVLDAPMISVAVRDEQNILTLSPWVRVFRHEAYEKEIEHERSRFLAVDVIHKDFFANYLEQHLLPFAQQAAVLVKKHADIIADNRAFVSGMGKNSSSRIESRLKQIDITKKTIRGRAVLRNIARFLTGRNPH